MTDTELVDLVEVYFAALDARDLSALGAVLAPDCALAIVTHDIRHDGRAAILDLFGTRWTGDTQALHHDFRHVPSGGTGRIATQFNVTYRRPGAPDEVKSNANFFTAKDGVLTRIEVYMSGQNTIRTGS